MSFSSIVKKEIAAAPEGDRHCRIAALSAMLCGAGRVREGPVVELRTENPYLTRKFYNMIKNDFSVKPSLVKKAGGAYVVTLNDTETAKKLCNAAGLWSEGGYARRVNSLVTRASCCRRAYLSGLFLAAGYVSDPSGAYHCEFNAGDARFADELSNLFEGFGLVPLRLSRKGRHGPALYFKDGEQIAEILRIIGAHAALMSFEDARIRKSVDNNINRGVNFDAANVDKSISAAVHQIESIKLIQREAGLGSLPKALEELARLRLEYPEMSLKEIGEKLIPPVSKSGVNHRLRKIREIASKLV